MSSRIASVMRSSFPYDETFSRTDQEIRPTVVVAEMVGQRHVTGSLWLPDSIPGMFETLLATPSQAIRSQARNGWKRIKQNSSPPPLHN